MHISRALIPLSLNSNGKSSEMFFDLLHAYVAYFTSPLTSLDYESQMLMWISAEYVVCPSGCERAPQDMSVTRQIGGLSGRTGMANGQSRHQLCFRVVKSGRSVYRKDTKIDIFQSC